MWKNLSNKIKTFAEDITSPAYDEELREGEVGDVVEGEHHRRGVYRMQEEESSSFLEASVRCLEKQYNVPTVELQPGATPSTAPPQPSPATKAALAGSKANGESNDEEEDDEESLRSSSSSRSMSPTAYGAPRRGPPMAMATPHQNQVPLSTSTGATNAAVTSIYSSSTPAAKKITAQAKSTADAEAASTQDARASATPLVHCSANEAHNNETNLSTSATLRSQQQRNTELEAEKAQMLADIRNYQEAVRVAHEQTVAYYEAQLREAQREAKAIILSSANTQEQLESCKAALHTAAETLEKEQAAKTALEQQLKFSEQEADELRTSMKDLQAKLNAAVSSPTPSSPSSHTDAEWMQKEAEFAKLKAKLAQQECEQHVAQAQLLQSADTARQTVEEQLNEAQTQIAVSQAVTSNNKQRQLTGHEEQLATLAAQSDSWKHQAEELKEKLAAAQLETRELAQQLAEEQQRNREALQSNYRPLHEANIEEVIELKQKMQLNEAARQTLETQLQEVRRELISTLASSEQVQQTEELEAMALELEAVRKHAKELEQELAAAEEQKTSLTSKLAEEQAKGVAANNNNVAASSRAAAEEVKQLLQKLQDSVGQCASLTSEVQQGKHTIDQLTNRLKTDERMHRETIAQMEEDHARAEAVLENELTEVKTTAAQGKQKLEEQLSALQVELQQLQKYSAKAAEESKAAEKMRAVAERNATAAMQQCAALESERAALQQQVQKYKDDLARQEQEVKRRTEYEKNSSTGISFAALSSVKRELEDKVQTLEITMDQVRHMTVDTLVRLGVDVEQAVQQQQNKNKNKSKDALYKPTPSSLYLSSSDKESKKNKASASLRSGSGNSSSKDGEEDEVEDAYADVSHHKAGQPLKAQEQLPLLQLFSLLTTECVQQHSILLRAERVQQEWEQTYEQARQVNESLNQHVADAWVTISKLREEVSVKDAAMRQMQSRVGTGDARLLEVQEELARATAEVQQLREEREAWAVRLQKAEATAERQEQTLASVNEELQSLQSMLQSKEEELLSSQQSLENLQMVLDRFQETKRHEVEVLTLESHFEAENLKKKLEECFRVIEQHEQEKAALRESYETQLAAKDAEVTTLHQKLAEVRKVLEKTTSRHMDGTQTSVDKRVVSQLLAKYIHAFIGQRKEAEDMLKVLSGLLDWDEATQEVAGLLPGPNNPHPPGSGPDGQRGGGGSRLGLFGWRRGNKASTTGKAAVVGHQGSEAAKTPDPNSKNKSGLASMWVEFLLKESEGGSNGATVGASSTPFTPAGASGNTSTVSDAPAAAAQPAASAATPTGQ